MYLRRRLRRFHDGNHGAEIAGVIVASVAGIAKYLNQMQKDKKPFKLGELIVKAIVAGFSGWLFFQAALVLGLEGGWQGLFVGIGGWMGADGIDFIWKDMIKPKLK